MRRVSLAVNGVRHELDLEPRELLVYPPRRLGLTGTNVGCDVLVRRLHRAPERESVKSCTLLGVQADGMELTTIEASPRTATCTRCSRRSTRSTGSSAATARPGW